MTKLRALSAALIAVLAIPAVADAAEKAKVGANEQVTKAMFVLIFLLIALLAGLAIWEARKGSKH